MLLILPFSIKLLCCLCSSFDMCIARHRATFRLPRVKPLSLCNLHAPRDLTTWNGMLFQAESSISGLCPCIDCFIRPPKERPDGGARLAAFEFAFRARRWEPQPAKLALSHVHATPQQKRRKHKVQLVTHLAAHTRDAGTGSTYGSCNPELGSSAFLLHTSINQHGTMKAHSNLTRPKAGFVHVCILLYLLVVEYRILNSCWRCRSTAAVEPPVQRHARLGTPAARRDV